MTKPQTPMFFKPARWVYVAWLCVFAVGITLSTPNASADHRWVGNYQIHNHRFHYASGDNTTFGGHDEQYCIESRDSRISDATASDFIRETLTLLDFSKIWDGTGNWRIDLWRTQQYCDSYDTATRDTIELEYLIAADWTWPCDPGYSCVREAGGYYDSTWGHTHFKWTNAHLLYSHVGARDARARAFINHETGHMWSLLDPQAGDACRYSIMHASIVGYYCTNYDYWPTSYDFTSVKAAMDGR